MIRREMRRTILLAVMIIALLGVTVPAYAGEYIGPADAPMYCDGFPTWYRGTYDMHTWCYIYNEQRWIMMWEE